MATTDAWSNVFVVVEITISLLGTLLNGLVILTMLRNISRISASNVFILSIAVSDFLSCTVAFPFSIDKHLQNDWPFGVPGCKAHAFVIFFLGLVSITHLSAISAEKYLTISKSLYKESYFFKKQALWIILGLWIYSLVFSLGPLFGLSDYEHEGANATCSIQWGSRHAAHQAYFGLVIFACYVLPIAIIVACYYKIHTLTKGIVAKGFQSNSYTMSMKQAMLRKQRRSAIYFLAVIVSILLSWTPYAVVSFLTVIGMKLNPLAIDVPGVFAKTSFFLNPILYALISRRFRRWMGLAIPIIKRNRIVRPRDVSSWGFGHR